MWLAFSAASVKISAVSVRKVSNLKNIKLLYIIFCYQEKVNNFEKHPNFVQGRWKKN
jgi:hypothetical protein